jgi:hypothetical protein
MAQQLTEWETLKQGLEQSIEKFKKLDKTALNPVLEKLQNSFSQKLDDLQKISSFPQASEVPEAAFPDLSNIQEIYDKKQQLLQMLPEPLKSILDNKDLTYEQLENLISKIQQQIEAKSKKAENEEEDRVLEDDIVEIVLEYEAIERIQKRNQQEQRQSQEEAKKQELTDFVSVCNKQPTIVDAAQLVTVVPTLLELSKQRGVTLDNIVDKLEEKISSKESSLDDLPEALQQEAKARVFKTLGQRDNWQYFKDESSLANQTMKEFIKLQSTPEFQMMTDEQKHMAWAQTFQEKIVDKTTNSEDLDKLFNIFNNEKYNKESHQNIKKLLDQEICDDLNNKTKTNQDSQQPYTIDQIPALRQELNFFGDYIRISQQALAQRSLRTMYSRFEEEKINKLPFEDKAKYQEYLKLKASVEQLAMPDCVKTITPSILPEQLISVAAKAPAPAAASDSDADAILEVSGSTILDPKLQSSNSAEITDAKLKRLSQLNLAQACLKNLVTELSEEQIQLFKPISDGGKYCQDRQLLSKALQSELFTPGEKKGFQDLFHQNHASFLQAYAEEKRQLVGLINSSTISPQDVSNYQQLHKDDFDDVQKLARLETEIKGDEKFKEILPVTERIQELTRVSADLKNKYDSVVILGNLKPVEITGPSTKPSEMGGSLIDEQKPYQIPFLAGGIKLHDDITNTTFEIKKLGEKNINFGRSDDSKMTEDQKNKLFISLSENILANWSPGKKVVLDVKNRDDALAFYYSMQKMSENFQTIHKERGYKSAEFSMDNVKVRVNGHYMDTSGLKELAKKQESWSPLGKNARLTTIGKEIEQSIKDHPYRHLAAERFQNEVSSWKLELEKERDSGKEVNKKLGVDVFKKMQEKFKFLTLSKVENETIEDYQEPEINQNSVQKK